MIFSSRRFFQKKMLQEVYWSKGQIISRGLFGVLEFSQKTNKQICCSSKNEFGCSFFGRIRGYQKSFWNYLTFTLVNNKFFHPTNFYGFQFLSFNKPTKSLTFLNPFFWVHPSASTIIKSNITWKCFQVLRVNGDIFYSLNFCCLLLRSIFVLS